MVFHIQLKKKIIGIIDKIKPDVIHHHNIAGLGPFILGVKAPIVLYTAHDYWLVCPLSGLVKYDKTYCTSKSNCFMCSLLSHRPIQLWRYSSILSKYLQNIDAIITPSNFMQDRLQKFDIKANFITIPNFVPSPPHTDGCIYDFPYLLFVGVLENHKGILDLIYAYMGAKDEIDEKLLIVGRGSLENKIKQILADNKLMDEVMILGWVDYLTLINLYKNAVATIVPSIWPENCPLVALESLVNGTPILVSNKGGLPELIRNDSFNGVIMNEVSSQELFRALSLLKSKYDNKLDFDNYNAEHYIQRIYTVMDTDDYEF